MSALQIVVYGAYGVLAGGVASILWNVRFTPFDRKVREFPVPKIDTGVELHLSNSSDAGVI